MLAAIKISDEEIEYAERILLPPGKTFDEERRIFIRNLATIDLQAVPGSGKTTALLAKLLILEKHLPFEDGSGILVLSHTNTAINELRGKLLPYCPKLFAYPNFIGTIQSFVDRYLAIPFGLNFLDVRFDKIDTSAFQDRLWQHYKSICWDEDFGQPAKFLWGRCKSRADKEAPKGTDGKPKQKESNAICNRLIEEAVRDMYCDFFRGVITQGLDGRVLLKDRNNDKFRSFQQVAYWTFQEGYLSFEYAYLLARNFLEIIPEVTSILRRRFRFAFVDEMQDMSGLQYSILELIFGDQGGVTAYQRIGDKNQAIYDGRIDLEEIWRDRDGDSLLRLTGSLRLNGSVASLVKPFGLTQIPIEGRCTSGSGIPPHILVYSKPEQVLPGYTKLLVEMIAANKIQDHPQNIYAAIAWIRKPDSGDDSDVERVTLPTYFPDYQSRAGHRAETYDSLSGYLDSIDLSGQAMRPIRSAILNALCRLLQIEKVKTKANHLYNPSTVHSFLLSLDSVDSQDRVGHLERKIYECATHLIIGNKHLAIESIREFAGTFVGWFGTLTTLGKSFLQSSTSAQNATSGSSISVKTDAEVNTFAENGIRVQVSTVHKVKGQTHTATLYMESTYYGHCECERVADQFLGKPIEVKKKRSGEFDRKQSLQSARVAYVALSRPTDLICLAVHRDRFAEYLGDIDRKRWKVIEL